MKSAHWRVWVVLGTVSVLGAKWMLADEFPDIAPPPTMQAGAGPAGEIAPPRPFEPTLPVSELPAAKRAEKRPVLGPGTEIEELSIPTDMKEEISSLPKRPATGRREGRRAELSSVDAVTPTAGFVPYEPAADPTAGTPARAEQNISLEWLGPAETRIGRPAEYEIVVQNHGAEAVNEVTVANIVPLGMRVVSVEPRALQQPDRQSWDVGTLGPGEEKRLRLSMVADQKGDFTCQATVTAQTTHRSTFRATEPMLNLRASANEKLMVGDTLTASVEISNPGDGPAEGVILQVRVSDGLRHEKGKEFTIEVGNILAGETRQVEVVCATAVGGKQNIFLTATGAGDLTADATIETHVAEAGLELALHGPTLRYLDRQAVYTIRVNNPGDAAADNVKVTATLPAGFRFAGSSVGGRHDFATSSINWVVGSIAPGEVKEISYKCLATQPGEQKHSVTAVAARGLKKDAVVSTQVEGISALLLEVVDVDDPVEVGSETSYEIRVTNQGSREATNVEIHALVPTEMAIRGGQGPTKYRVEGQEVLFAPLAKLAPRADAIYRVMVQGSSSGDVRFRARLISDSLTEPVIEEESTKVYGDE